MCLPKRVLNHSFSFSIPAQPTETSSGLWLNSVARRAQIKTNNIFPSKFFKLMQKLWTTI